MDTVKINLGQKLSRRAPKPEPGRYAFTEAIVPAVISFILFLVVAQGSVWIAEKYFSWKVAPFAQANADKILIVAGVLLSVLLAAASQRAEADKVANGSITTAFRLIAHGVKGNQEILRTLAVLAWSVYHFFRREKVEIYDQEGRLLQGFQPILPILLNRIDALPAQELATERKLELLTQGREMTAALGGIASRRMYVILKSRYINNIIFAGLGVLMVMLSAVTGDINPWVGYTIAFFFTYGLTAIFKIIQHLADGIGYDPGDVRPDRSLESWLVEIDAAWPERFKAIGKNSPWKSEA